MSSLTEILIIVAIALIIFLLPRLAGKRQEQHNERVHPGLQISGWTRLAILGSFLWVAGVLLYLKPWNAATGWQVCTWAGIGPVGVFWGVFWVFCGFKRK